MTILSDRKVVCLFSILCFGKLRENQFLSKGCQAYDFNQDMISVHCEDDYSFGLSSQVADIHTLSLVGVNNESLHLQLVDLSFKHLIIRDWDMSNHYKDKDKTVFMFNRHQSLTVHSVQNLQAWRWADYEFEQIHIEKSSITRVGSQRLSVLLARRLFSYRIVELYIIDCQLLSIDPEVFFHAPLLRTLTLSHNTLSAVMTASFPIKLKNLWLLDLSFNSLTFLDSDLFERFPSLVELNLSHNHLTDFSYDLIKPIWFHLSLIQLLENKFNCRDLCWSLDKESFPHPIAFDQTTCSNGYLKDLVIGSMNILFPICFYQWNIHQFNNQLISSNHSSS